MANESKKSGSGSMLWIVVLIVVVGGLIWAGSKMMNSQSAGTSTAPTVATSEAPTATATAEAPSAEAPSKP